MNVHDGGFKSKGLAFIDDNQANKLSNVIIEENDVLLNITGASIARCCVVPLNILPARVNQHVSILRPNKDLLNSHFLAYLLISNQYKSELLESGNKAGATREALTKSQLQNLNIYYPSLSEQKRIMAVLNNVFADVEQARAKTEQNLKNARELFDSYLQQVFSQKGDVWIDTDIESLVGTGILDKPIDGNHGETHPKKADFVDIGVPFIMASDIKDGIVDTKNCSFLSKTQADSLRKGFAKDGDVLLSHKATIGRTAILKTDLDYVMLTPQVTYYRVLDNQTLINEYVYWYFNNPTFLNEMNEYAGVGSTRAYIGITKQRKLKFTYPEIGKQKVIVSKLKLMSKELADLEPIYKAKLLAIDELKTSILQKAFNGKLTVSGK
jgi:type I restriction enzyme S subunit